MPKAVARFCRPPLHQTKVHFASLYYPFLETPGPFSSFPIRISQIRNMINDTSLLFRSQHKEPFLSRGLYSDITSILSLYYFNTEHSIYTVPMLRVRNLQNYFAVSVLKTRIRIRLLLCTVKCHQKVQ